MTALVPRPLLLIQCVRSGPDQLKEYKVRIVVVMPYRLCGTIRDIDLEWSGVVKWTDFVSFSTRVVGLRSRCRKSKLVVLEWSVSVSVIWTAGCEYQQLQRGVPLATA
jgi:hypothetical protein